MRKRIILSLFLILLPALFSLSGEEVDRLSLYFYDAIAADLTEQEEVFLERNQWNIKSEPFELEVNMTGSQYDFTMMYLDDSSPDVFTEILEDANVIEQRMIGEIVVKLYKNNQILRDHIEGFRNDQKAIEASYNRTQTQLNDAIAESTQILTDYMNEGIDNMSYSRMDYWSERMNDSTYRMESLSQNLNILQEQYSAINSMVSASESLVQGMDPVLEEYRRLYRETVGDSIEGQLILCDIVAGTMSPSALEPYAEEGLRIITEPTGAEILFNGFSLGTSPQTLPWLLSGNYSLTATMDMYQSASQTITAGENTEVRLVLDPMVRLSLTSLLPSDTRVRISGEGQAFTLSPGQTREIPEGQYSAAFSGEIIIPDEKTFTWEGPAQIDIGDDMEYRKGNLSLAISPAEGEIYINGERYTGNGNSEIELPIGDYDFEFISSVPGYDRYRSRISIKENRTANLRKEMIGNAELTLSSDSWGVDFYLSNPSYGTFESDEDTLELPAGRWHIEAVDGEGSASTTVLLDVGDSKTVELNPEGRTSINLLGAADLRFGGNEGEDLLSMFTLGTRFDFSFAEGSGLFIKAMAGFGEEGAEYDNPFSTTLLEGRASLGYHGEWGDPEIGFCLGIGPAVDYLYYQVQSPFSSTPSEASQLTAGIEGYLGCWLLGLYCDLTYYHLIPELTFPALDPNEEFINPSAFAMSFGIHIPLGGAYRDGVEDISELNREKK